MKTQTQIKADYQKNQTHVRRVLVGLAIIFLSSVANIETWAKMNIDPTLVSLSQTPGEFTTTELKLESGRTYVFEVTNINVDHPVAFIVAHFDAKKIKKKHHIQESYLSQVVLRGESSRSKAVTLTVGEYVYWCPLNPTKKYMLTVD